MLRLCLIKSPLPSRVEVFVFIVFVLSVWTLQASTDLVTDTVGEEDWSLNLGWEFPGAEGKIERSESDVESAFIVSGNFTGGGSYVGAEFDLSGLALASTPLLSISYRTDRANQITLRLIDGEGQVFQKRVFLKADGSVHWLHFLPASTQWSEYWGAAGDGVWRGSPTLVSIILGADSWPDRMPQLELRSVQLLSETDIQAEGTDRIFYDFESSEFAQPWTWQNAKLQNDETESVLRLERLDGEQGEHCFASSPEFAVTSETLFLSFDWDWKINSPDNSYRVLVRLVCLDESGLLLEQRTLVEKGGEAERSRFEAIEDLPLDCTSVRLSFELEKASGFVSIDNVSLFQLQGDGNRLNPIRVEAWSNALGNLFLPGENLHFQLSASGIGEIDAEQLSMRAFAKTYGGELVMPQLRVDDLLINDEAGEWSASGDLSLPQGRFEVGRYYQLELTVIQAGETVASDVYGFAILPEAPNNALPHESVPFTARNWDARIDEYLHLASRLGIRVVNLWGGWEKQSPYEPWVDNLELAESLDLKWIIGTPAIQLEQGDWDWNRENLRGGMFDFASAYADRGLFAVSTGNEPHATDEQVARFVAGYQGIYEGAKAYDSEIEVIATSVEPDSRYWDAGLAQWCDSYDYHVYQGYRDIEKVFDEFRGLMNAFKAEKPIRSTELGLNSKGMPRHIVAAEMYRSLSTHFAQGGTSASWFTFLYPDSEGTSQGESGMSHCMFGSQYNRYHPKLEAISYYHFLNTIGDRKFVEEKRMTNGTILVRFSNDESSVCVVWNDEGPVHLSIPLEKGSVLALRLLDGHKKEFTADENGIELQVDGEPFLLSTQALFTLGQATESSGFQPELSSQSLSRGEDFSLAIQSPSAVGGLVEARLGKIKLKSESLDSDRWRFTGLVSEWEKASTLPLEVLFRSADGKSHSLYRTPIEVENPLQEMPSEQSPSSPSGLSVN